MIYSTGYLVFAILFALITWITAMMGIKKPYMYLFTLIAFVFMCISFNKACTRPDPTFQDVMENKAKIIEMQTIIDKDTTKTYQMVWNE